MNKKVYAEDLFSGIATHPGELLREEIEVREMTQKEMAKKMKIRANVLSEIINGKRNITPTTAIKLEDILGISAEFWMKLQVGYEIDLIRIKYRNQLKKANISSSRKDNLATSIKE